jgi:hypothetical protein
MRAGTAVLLGRVFSDLAYLLRTDQGDLVIPGHAEDDRTCR